MGVCGLYCQQACRFEIILYKLNESHLTNSLFETGNLCNAAAMAVRLHQAGGILGRNSVPRGFGCVSRAQKGRKRSPGHGAGIHWEMLAPFRDLMPIWDLFSFLIKLRKLDKIRVSSTLV